MTKKGELVETEETGLGSWNSVVSLQRRNEDGNERERETDRKNVENLKTVQRFSLVMLLCVF